MNQFGNIVKHYLLDNNLKQQDIINNLSISKGALSQLLNNDNVSLKKMLMIANALDCDLEITLKKRLDNSDLP